MNGLKGSVSGASWVRLAPDLAGYTSPLPVVVIENFNAGPVPAKGLSNQQVVAQAAVVVQAVVVALVVVPVDQVVADVVVLVVVVAQGAEAQPNDRAGQD